MPLAKLSERFYQKFGHDLVEELVTWLNGMDATYRTDLRELNELNFARFDAKLEQRIAELRAELRQELEQLRVELRAGLGDGRAALQGLRGEFGERLEAQTGKLLRWMLGIWVAAIPTLAGVVVLVEHLLAAART